MAIILTSHENSLYGGHGHLACNELELTCHWKPRGPVAAIYHRVISHPKEVLSTLLPTKPVHATSFQVNGLQHCEGGGVRLGLSQATASLFTES